MKTCKALTATVIGWLITATPVLAAGAIREDHSSLVVWVFLGFCALIVIAQLVPAILLLIGMIKGVVAPREEATEKTAK